MTVSSDCLKDETDVLVILEFKGIRCSARDFHIEIELKQMMIIKPVQLFANCAIRPPQKIKFKIKVKFKIKIIIIIKILQICCMQGFEVLSSRQATA
jgi:hypothetical protein